MWTCCVVLLLSVSVYTPSIPWAVWGQTVFIASPWYVFVSGNSMRKMNEWLAYLRMAPSPAVLHNTPLAPQRPVGPCVWVASHHLFALPSLSSCPSLCLSRYRGQKRKSPAWVDTRPRNDRPVSSACRLPLLVYDSPSSPSCGFSVVGMGLKLGLRGYQPSLGEETKRTFSGPQLPAPRVLLQCLYAGWAEDVVEIHLVLPASSKFWGAVLTLAVLLRMGVL